jgi:MYXO-CTERM domain-containing protein
LLAANTTFNPVVLADSKVSSVSVSDTTSTIPVISTSSLSDIIGISGISGGLSVTVTGQMTSTYTTDSISLGDATFTSAAGSAAIDAPAGGYGTSLAVTAGAVGNVHYVPALVFAANFNVSIFGIKVVNLQLSNISLPLDQIDRPVTLTGSPTQIGLPHLDTIPQSLGFASGASQELQLHNSGNAPLMIELATGDTSGTTADPVTIEPGSDGIVDVTAADPTMLGGSLVLSTNDPNHPTISIALDAASAGQTNPPAGSGSDSGDAGDPTGEGGGCNAGGSSGGGLALLALGLIVARRRR